MGDYKKALQDIDKSLEIRPKSDFYLYTKALVYLKSGRFQEATDILKQAITLARESYNENPENYKNSFRLALYHLANSDTEESNWLYKRVLNCCINAHTVNVATFDLEKFLIIFPDHQDGLAILQLTRNTLSKLSRGK